MLRTPPRVAPLLRFAIVTVAAVVAVAAPPARADARPFGSTPLDDVIAAADQNKRPECNLSRDYLAALAIAPVYPETGGSTSIPPSPFTLSRSDTSAGLYAFGSPSTPYPRAFFHPGIGLWQADSGGLAAPHSADYWVNTATAAPVVTAEIARLWCQAWANPATYPTDAARRARAWSPWTACRHSSAPCETIFREVFNGTSLVNVTRFTNVSRTGGLQSRTCRTAAGVSLRCWLADPARVEGNNAWTAPGFGPSPVTAPFYVYEVNGAEHRHWLRADTGYPDDIHAIRPLTANPRTGLTWQLGGGLCDLDAGRGSCAPNEGLGPPHPAVATDPDTVGPGRGIGSQAAGSGVVIAERRSDGSVRVVTSAVGSTTFAYLGGMTPSDPDITTVVGGGLEVVVRGVDNALWQRRWSSSGWAPWRTLGGAVTSAPSTGSRIGGLTDVFVRGTDNALWTAQASASGFSGWSPLGGVLESDPEVAVGPDGRMTVFVVGSDRGIWYRTFDGGSWQPWTPLGGLLTSSPGAVSPLAGHLDIVARGADGALWTRGFHGPGWSPWAPLGGAVVGASDLVALGSTDVRAFARGVDDRLWFRTRVGADWTAWAPVPW